MNEEPRRVLGHRLTGLGFYERDVDSPDGKRPVVTQRVSCSRCGGSWPGYGFVLAKCESSLHNPEGEE